jgi:hypothetical protein
MLLDRAVLYDFELAGRRVRLWKRLGESYEHVLMKALAYAMFVPLYPGLEIERRVGLRYKPDLVAQGSDGRFLFWGECGANSVRKTAWLLKHARALSAWPSSRWKAASRSWPDSCAPPSPRATVRRAASV